MPLSMRQPRPDSRICFQVKALICFEVVPLHTEAEFCMKRELNSNLSGDEIDYTNSLILPGTNMLCSKLHCQEGFNPLFT